MIANLIENLRTANLRPAERGAFARTVDATRAAHADWQFERDVAAVMAALDRLSDRRLALIGMRREALFDAVAEMIARTQADRAATSEILSLADERGDAMGPARAQGAAHVQPFDDTKAGRAA